ncbi:hypothetical protein DER45DRAFT_558487 [Fusarium avenaceum]|nr:hypothetical protein DER45DRAFT_558487 [Fusarium avenaceum]
MLVVLSVLTTALASGISYLLNKLYLRWAWVHDIFYASYHLIKRNVRPSGLFKDSPSCKKKHCMGQIGCYLLSQPVSHVVKCRPVKKDSLSRVRILWLFNNTLPRSALSKNGEVLLPC